MKILFPTISNVIRNLENRGIYPDLVRTLAEEGHEVYIVFPLKLKEKTTMYTEANVHFLGIPVGEMTKAGIIQRMLAMAKISWKYEKGIQKFFKGVKFDAILYATPPITFNKLIRQLKRKHKAFCYLMLKDIFPQNAVDLGMIKQSGLIHRYFRAKEEKLYSISDFIGCMSPANVQYILENNPNIKLDKVGLCPNAIEIRNKPMLEAEKAQVRLEHGIPPEKIVIIYGGNLGKPQGIDFLLEVLKDSSKREELFFVVAGSGTEVKRIKAFLNQEDYSNITLFEDMERLKYDRLEASADIALILLDYRFTIPNFPSRMLSYMENGLPMLFATDKVSDAGLIAEKENFGLKVEHGNLAQFNEALDKLVLDKAYRERLASNARSFLEKNYQVKQACDSINKTIGQFIN